jgi:hypothetical protein
VQPTDFDRRSREGTGHGAIDGRCGAADSVAAMNAIHSKRAVSLARRVFAKFA